MKQTTASSFKFPTALLQLSWLPLWKTSPKVPLSTSTAGDDIRPAISRRLPSNIARLIIDTISLMQIPESTLSISNACGDQQSGGTSVIEERPDTILRPTCPSSCAGANYPLESTHSTPSWRPSPTSCHPNNTIIVCYLEKYT